MEDSYSTAFFLALKLISVFHFAGVVLPRRVRLRQRSHPEQLEQVGEEDQGVDQTVRRHLPLLNRAVQVHRGGS